MDVICSAGNLAGIACDEISGRNSNLNDDGVFGLGFTALSIYADAFRQFGWTGVLVICVMFGIMTQHSLRMISNRQFFFLPTVVIAVMATSQIPTQFPIQSVDLIPIHAAYLVGIIFIF